MSKQVETKVETSALEVSTQFEQILDRIKFVAKIEQDADVDKIVGKRGNVYAARKKGKIPPGWLVKISEEYDVSIDWLYYGVGPMKRGEQPNVDAEVSETDSFVPAALDMELFTNTIRVVETGLAKKNIQLAPDKKAQLIALMYEYFTEMDREVEERTVERYLKLVS